MPREHPPFQGTLTVTVPCSRPFRGELVSILTHLANGDPIGSRARASLQRLNAAVASAPWSISPPPPCSPVRAEGPADDVDRADGLGAQAVGS